MNNYKNDIIKHKEKYPKDDYGIYCYESAGEIMETIDKMLCKQGQSGFSASITKKILVTWLEDKTIYPEEK